MNYFFIYVSKINRGNKKQHFSKCRKNSVKIAFKLCDWITRIKTIVNNHAEWLSGAPIMNQVVPCKCRLPHTFVQHKVPSYILLFHIQEQTCTCEHEVFITQRPVFNNLPTLAPWDEVAPPEWSWPPEVNFVPYGKCSPLHTTQGSTLSIIW
jgi:hypothetical protein